MKHKDKAPMSVNTSSQDSTYTPTSDSAHTPDQGRTHVSSRNAITYGVGTIGRDMVYAMISMFLIFYFTDIIRLPTVQLSILIGITVALRVFDAINDPVMGVIVDNTHTRWGQFKPWIALGTALSGIMTLLLFAGFNLSDWGAVAFFGCIYMLWGVSYTINDLGYWSMLPALSMDKKQRERIGSIARICANIGLFFAVACIMPLTNAFATGLGSQTKGWFAFALMVTVIMWCGQLVTLIGVKQPAVLADKPKQSTTLREMFSIILKNDQLACTALSMGLFMIGYTTTTTFGIYYFKYIYGDEGMYPVFTVILGVSQLAAQAVFPYFAGRFSRERLYAAAITLIGAGYLLFFVAPTSTMAFIGVAGVLIFVGQGFIQILMLMFLTDSVDYGHWKFKKRNDSVTFSLQPFIYKTGGAIATGVVGAVAVLSGMRAVEDTGGAALTAGGELLVKSGMLIFPLLCIAAGFIIFKAKYRLNKEKHDEILADLRKWGEILDES